MEQQSSTGPERVVPGPLAQAAANEYAARQGLSAPYPDGPSNPNVAAGVARLFGRATYPAGMNMPDLRQVASVAVATQGAKHVPVELAVALAVAAIVRPVVYLEIGTYAGGTAWAFSHIPSVEVIISIDYAPQPDAAKRLADIPCEAYQLGTNSHHYETLVRAQQILASRPVDLLVIDGSTDYHSALADWEIYRPMVRPGGLVMMHDTQPHKDRAAVEVHRLWAQIEEANLTTEVVSQPGIWAGTGLVWV